MSTTKIMFYKAYRIARCPDLYMACDVDGVYRYKLNLPLGLFKLAELCLNKRNGCN